MEKGAAPKCNSYAFEGSPDNFLKRYDFDDCRKKNAKYNAKQGWNQRGECGPFETARFLFDGKECSGTGPMEQEKDEDAYGGCPSPAVCNKDILCCGK